MRRSRNEGSRFGPPEGAIAFPQSASYGALGKPFTSKMSTLPAVHDPMGERAVPQGRKGRRLRYNSRHILNVLQLGFIYRFLLTY
jgi:hypothetical protein